MNNRDGFVYLLHFEQPIAKGHPCQHYLGWTKDLAARIQAHRLGNGARLTAVAKERGIGFQVARVWRGSRVFERKLKNRKNGRCLCSVCSDKALVKRNELTPEQINEELLPF